MNTLTPEQKELLDKIFVWFKKETEDTIADYGDLPGHARAIQEMKRELELVEEIQQKVL